MSSRMYVTPNLDLPEDVCLTITRAVFDEIQSKAGANVFRTHFAKCLANDGGTNQFAQTVVMAYAMYNYQVRTNNVHGGQMQLIVNCVQDAVSGMVGLRCHSDANNNLDSVSRENINSALNVYNRWITQMAGFYGDGIRILSGMNTQNAFAPISNPFGARSIQSNSGSMFGGGNNNADPFRGMGGNSDNSNIFSSSSANNKSGSSSAAFNSSSSMTTSFSASPAGSTRLSAARETPVPTPAARTTTPVPQVKKIEDMEETPRSRLSESKIREILKHWKPTEQYGYHIPVPRYGYEQFFTVRGGQVIISEEIMKEEDHVVAVFAETAVEGKAEPANSEEAESLANYRRDLQIFNIKEEPEAYIEASIDAAISAAMTERVGRRPSAVVGRTNSYVSRRVITTIASLPILVRDSLKQSTNAKTFKEMHSAYCALMGLIKSNSTMITAFREMVRLDKILTQRTNQILSLKLSVGTLTIGSFEEDAGELANYLLEKKNLPLAASKIDEFLRVIYIQTFSFLETKEAAVILGLPEETSPADFGDTVVSVREITIMDIDGPLDVLKIGEFNNGMTYVIQDDKTGLATMLQNVFAKTRTDVMYVLTKDCCIIEVMPAGINASMFSLRLV